MPSPFPGVDPFIEGQEWEDFHHEFIAVAREMLVPRVRPRYIVRVEKHLYLDLEPGEQIRFVQPDVVVLEAESGRRPSAGVGTAATAVAVAPVVLTVPIRAPRRVAYLTIRERETMEIVTLIELLSPTNKRQGSAGRRKYLRKRENTLLSTTHLVELDLLRGGARLPTIEPLPPADYYAFVCREQRRPKAEVYAWSLQQPLPTIPVPLAGDDPDVPLDLQAVCTTVYDRAGYDYSLDYRRPIEPPLSQADAEWAQRLLAAAMSPPA